MNFPLLRKCRVRRKDDVTRAQVAHIFQLGFRVMTTPVEVTLTKVSRKFVTRSHTRSSRSVRSRTSLIPFPSCRELKRRLVSSVQAGLYMFNDIRERGTITRVPPEPSEFGSCLTDCDPLSQSLSWAMSDIILSVLPRPMKSARIPPLKGAGGVQRNDELTLLM